MTTGTIITIGSQILHKIVTLIVFFFFVFFFGVVFSHLRDSITLKFLG